MSDKKVSDKRMKDTGFALACWILVALILLVFFFVKKDTIVSNLRHTNFVNRVMGRATDEEAQSAASATTGEADDVGADGEEDDGDINIAGAAGINTDSNNIQASNVPTDIEQPPADDLAAPSDDGAGAPADVQSPPDAAVSSPPTADTPTTDAPPVRPMPKPVVTESAPPAPATMNVKLCFVVIDGDGIVSRRIAQRALPRTTSPLTASINALLAGPTDGSQTLIPDGTRLLSAEVRGGVATLNFSEEFAFNPVGVEGYMAQLMQVVYTATSFSTVNSVQFVINGQHVDYLGSEGEWIGSPLSRASFR